MVQPSWLVGWLARYEVSLRENISYTIHDMWGNILVMETRREKNGTIKKLKHFSWTNNEMTQNRFWLKRESCSQNESSIHWLRTFFRFFSWLCSHFHSAMLWEEKLHACGSPWAGLGCEIPSEPGKKTLKLRENCEAGTPRGNWNESSLIIKKINACWLYLFPNDLLSTNQR